MGFSDQDKDDLRTYLGYSSRFYQTVNTALEMGMASIATDTYAVSTIQALIARCKDVDTKLADADRRQKFERAEDLTYAGYREIAALRSQGRQAVGRISAKLGVPVLHDAFSASGSHGVPGTLGSSSGSLMKLG